MELGWTPEQFWRSPVQDFWAAVDWIAERNLDQDDEFEAAREHGGSPQVFKNAGPVARNPDLSVPKRPGWFAWRDQVRANRASGKLVMRQLGGKAA